MRSDIVPGVIFPDYQLTDHSAKRRKLSELQGQNPMVLVLSRGGFCPKDRRQAEGLVELHRELEVAYCRLVTISTDNITLTNEYRSGVGAHWPFLSDAGRIVQKDLDVAEYTDPVNNPMIPHVIVLEPGLVVYKIYNGYWFFGRPTIEDLRQDLRAVTRKCRPDWDITTPELKAAWQQERSWKPATVNRYTALLSLAFRLAVANGKVSSNPVRLVRRLQEQNGVIKFLDTSEERRLRAAIEPKHPRRWAQISFAMNTGLRASEQKRALWADIDVERRQVHVKVSKNGAARHIPLNEPAMEALAILRGSSDLERVFPQQHYRMWFEIALEASGVKDFHWHCLRHTFASRLVMAGVDICTVAELMGHRDLKMTMRYAHLSPAHNADAVAKLNRYATDTRSDTTGLAEVVPIE